MFSTMFRKKPLFVVLLLLLLLALISSACRPRIKGRKPSPDWSRSIPVGVPLRGDIGMTAHDAITHLVWLQEENEEEIIHYLQLDEAVKPLIDRNLELPGDQVRRPQIGQTAGPNLHLLWSTRQEGQREWDLRYGQIGPQGVLAPETRKVAAADQDVGEFSIAPDGEGGLFVFWEAADEGALYGTQISSAGETIQQPILLVDQGESPYLASDGDHVYGSWLDNGNVFYGQLPSPQLAPIRGTRVTDITLGTGETLDGPALGLGGDWAYIVWSTYSSSGLEAGTAATKYVAFSMDDPLLGTGETVRVSSAEETPYAPYESAYQITQLAPPAAISESSGLVRQPFPAAGRDDELAVAVAVAQESRLDEIVQVGVLLFKQGVYQGYQMAGKTEAFSQQPVLAADMTGNLHLAWREGGRGSQAYYAVTSAEGRQALDRMSGGDVASTALGGGIEVVAGMLFFPLACVWIFPGLLLIGLLHLYRGESELRDPLTLVVLLVSVVASQIVKFAFLPTISFYIPFSAWLDISPSWEEPLRYMVPIMTLGTGILAAFLLRKRYDSALAFFFIVIAVDALLTLAIYGVNFLGVF